MKNNQITIEYLNHGIDRYSDFFKLLQKSNKFNLSSFKNIAVINFNNIDLGFVGVKFIEDYIELSLYKSPNTCRLSVITLTEAAACIAKDLMSENQDSVFLNTSGLYKARLISIYPKAVETSDSIRVTSQDILNVDLNVKTNKKIVLIKS